MSDSASVSINTDTNTVSVPDPSTVQRPDHIPEKFWDAAKGEVRVEEMAKSYSALETKIGGTKPADPPAAVTPPADADAAAKALQAKGVDYAALQSEWLEKGDLTPETRADLNQRGITDEVIASHVEAMKAVADGHRTYALDGVGEEKYAAITEWAGKNMPAADIEAYNKLTATAKSKEDLKAAVSNLVARYEQANGKDPQLVDGKAAAATGSVYRDISEMQKDMADPRYEKSAAFRADVEAKLARSSIM